MATCGEGCGECSFEGLNLLRTALLVVVDVVEVMERVGRGCGGVLVVEPFQRVKQIWDCSHVENVLQESNRKRFARRKRKLR